jgi:general secretion pathway protein L
MSYNKLLNNRLVASFDLHGELLLADMDGKPLDFDQTLESLHSERALEREITIVWVPTQQVVMDRVIVPGKRKAHWQAALPYSLEEGLTERLDEYHIVAYERDSNDCVSAAVVSHHNMQAWSEKLAELGLENAVLVPDCFRIPFKQEDDNPWFTCECEQALLVRTSLEQGFAADLNWFEVIKSQAEQSSDSFLKQHAVEKRALLSSAKLNLPQVSKLSLSQGQYKNSSKGAQGLAEWRWVGVLSVLVFGVWLGLQVFQNQQLIEQAEHTRAQSEKLFKTLFPESKRIVNIKAQTLSKLKQGGAPSGEVAELMPVLQAIEPWFENSKRVKLVELKWDQAKVDKLILKVQAPKSTDIEKLIQLSNKPASKVSMRLTLKNVTSELAEGEIYVAAN